MRGARDEAVSAHRARILELLDREDPAMVTELADHLGVTASTMSVTLSRLEREGLVSRRRDPEDRRVVNVRLTEEGERARIEAGELDPLRVAALLDLLDEHDRAAAVHGMVLLAEAADRLMARTDDYLDSLVGGGEP